MNICLFRHGSVLVRINLVPYKYVARLYVLCCDTYYKRIRIYAQHLKLHTILIVRV